MESFLLAWIAYWVVGMLAMLAIDLNRDGLLPPRKAVVMLVLWPITLIAFITAYWFTDK